LYKNTKVIIHAQALIRGWLQRRKYRTAKSNYEMATKYFKSDEGKETLGGAFKADSPIEIRSYTYKSGAIYNG